MNPWIGWTIAVLAFAVGYYNYGWQGVIFAGTIVSFWLLMQLSQTLRVMRVAGQSPVGHVQSAVMLQSKLKPGMRLLDVLRITRSLGRQVSEQPETFAWTDDGSDEVRVEFERGRCMRWELRRPPEPAAPQPTGPEGAL
jgi:hypothetical protein